jgi:hypothetical protein
MTTVSTFAMLGLGVFKLLLVPLVLMFVLALTVFWVWMLIDCAKRISAGETTLIGWVIVIALTHVIGALAYLLFGRRPRMAV